MAAISSNNYVGLLQAATRQMQSRGTLTSEKQTVAVKVIEPASATPQDQPSVSAHQGRIINITV